MTPLCKFCGVLYTYIKTNFSNPIKSKKLERWRQETLFLIALRPPSFIKMPLKSVYK